MNLQETNRLLIFAASVDNRRFDDATVMAWQEILADVDFDDAREAVGHHFRNCRDYLMPVHVHEGAWALAHERARSVVRLRLAASNEADVQHTLTAVATGDRSVDVQALIHDLREKLPKTDADVLHPRKAFWRRERRIRREVVPNPHFTGFPVPEESA